MKVKKIASLMLVLLIHSIVISQNDTKVEERFIEVTGKAEMEIVPDEIFIAISLKERTSNREVVTIKEQEEKLKNAINELKIPIENLFLSDANADYVRVKWTKKEVISRKEYLLKVSSALIVGKVFEKLDELKIEDAQVSKVSHSKIIEFRKEVRINAIKAAKEKADYLLKAIGEKCGKALKVLEVAPNNFTLNNVRGVRGAYSERKGYLSSSMDLDKLSVIEFQKIKLNASIYVKFKIE